MNLRQIAVLACTFLAGGLILVPGCGKTNHAPEIIGITAAPSDSVPVGGSIKLAVTATDADDDVLTFAWQATGGMLSAAAGDSAEWTATAAGSFTITVTCRDGNDGVDTATKAVRAYQTGLFESARGATSDSTYLPAAATFIPFRLDEDVPDGVLIDSAFASIDLEPDTVGEFFRIWVVSPGGSEVLVYDGLNDEPDMEDVLLQGIKGETAKGSWQLKVVRDNSSIARYARECSIDIHYCY
jgi:hypothetical protein